MAGINLKNGILNIRPASDNYLHINSKDTVTGIKLYATSSDDYAISVQNDVINIDNITTNSDTLLQIRRNAADNYGASSFTRAYNGVSLVTVSADAAITSGLPRLYLQDTTGNADAQINFEATDAQSGGGFHIDYNNDASGSGDDTFESTLFRTHLAYTWAQHNLYLSNSDGTSDIHLYLCNDVVNHADNPNLDLAVSSASGEFRKGEKITGAPSGATAYISNALPIGDPTTSMTVTPLSGTLTTADTITGGQTGVTADIDTITPAPDDPGDYVLGGEGALRGRLGQFAYDVSANLLVVENYRENGQIRLVPGDTLYGNSIVEIYGDNPTLRFTDTVNHDYQIRVDGNISYLENLNGRAELWVHTDVETGTGSPADPDVKLVLAQDRDPGGGPVTTSVVQMVYDDSDDSFKIQTLQDDDDINLIPSGSGTAQVNGNEIWHDGNTGSRVGINELKTSTFPKHTYERKEFSGTGVIIDHSFTGGLVPYYYHIPRPQWSGGAGGVADWYWEVKLSSAVSGYTHWRFGFQVQQGSTQNYVLQRTNDPFTLWQTNSTATATLQDLHLEFSESSTFDFNARTASPNIAWQVLFGFGTAYVERVRFNVVTHTGIDSGNVNRASYAGHYIGSRTVTAP